MRDLLYSRAHSYPSLYTAEHGTTMRKDPQQGLLSLSQNQELNTSPTELPRYLLIEHLYELL